MLTPFEFVASLSHDAATEKFFLEIPADIQSKGELLAAFAKAGKFPEYFGSNWDALLDCLRDFGWVRERKIVIMHSDVPLRANPADCRIYLEILREAANDWVRTAGQARDKTGASEFPDHELQVIFPDAERRTIADVLIT